MQTATRPHSCALLLICFDFVFFFFLFFVQGMETMRISTCIFICKSELTVLFLTRQKEKQVDSQPIGLGSRWFCRTEGPGIPLAWSPWRRTKSQTSPKEALWLSTFPAQPLAPLESFPLVTHDV